MCSPKFNTKERTTRGLGSCGNPNACSLDERQCDICHNEGGDYDRKPMFDGVDHSLIKAPSPRTMTWDFVKRLQDTTTMKVYINGIVTGEDAALCVENGVHGIVVSNHGGRAEASNRGKRSNACRR